MTTLTGTTWYMRQSGSTIQRSTDNATWTTVTSWPVNLGTTGGTILTFVTDLSFNSRTQYFTVGNNNQIIDGSYNTVYINNVNGYPGLVGNGTWLYTSNVLGSALNSKDNIRVKNITLTSVNSSLLAISKNSSTGTASSAKVGSGWICQAYFGNKSAAQTNTCNVSNCNTNGSTTSPSQDYTIYWTKSSRGDIGTASNIYADNTATTAGGCIVGDYSITNVNNCYSTGTIGSYGGGIVGAYAGNYGVISTVTKCFSRGSIGSYGGGIVGSNAAANITYCYSTGSIADNAGGIIGNTANSATVTGCYSTGNMSGTSSGGIFGSTAGTTTSITNCYTTGTGPNPLTSSQTSKPSKSGTYFTSGGTWIDASANAALTVSGVWTDISQNSTSVPYRLSSITTTLYNTSSGTNITSQTASLSGSYTWSIGSISVTDAFGSVTSFYEYTGIISINSSTGELTFSNLSGSIYAVNVMIEDANGLYWFQTFTNTVTPMIGYIGSFSGVKKNHQIILHGRI